MTKEHDFRKMLADARKLADQEHARRYAEIERFANRWTALLNRVEKPTLCMKIGTAIQLIGATMPENEKLALNRIGRGLFLCDDAMTVLRSVLYRDDETVVWAPFWDALPIAEEIATQYLLQSAAEATP